jgi:uncharacterized protein YdiU (UPF0061 family)
MKLNFINSFARLPEKFFSHTEIESFEEPFLISYNHALAAELGLPEANEQELADIFSGKKLPNGAEVISSIYAGHQFGSYVPQLGDGRAHLIGEILNPKGKSFELQLKGSGKTPYSRFGDGKAVLRSSIREYLCSEAMHGLGIPTTRALALVGSNESVMREGIEKAAMVCRVSESFVRFGHFEYFAHRGDAEAVKILADYVITKFYPKLENAENKYQKFFYEIVSRTAKLMAKWQSVGFAHGVMNTDNFSILGLTIDYGPFGFMDTFQPGLIPNCSDYSGRYSFENQPSIGLWNLYALASALESLLPKEEAKEILQLYQSILIREYTDIMRHKLGLRNKRPKDLQLASDLLSLMAAFEVDYNIFFRRLGEYKPCYQREDEDGRINNAEIYILFKKPDAFDEWQHRYRERLHQEDWAERNVRGEAVDDERKTRMNLANPKYILRNYMAEQAIRQATYAHDFSEVERLLKLLSNPYEDQPEFENYANEPPEWARGISLSCSS